MALINMFPQGGGSGGGGADNRYMDWGNLIEHPFGTINNSSGVANINGVAVAWVTFPSGQGTKIARSTDNGLTWSEFIDNPFGANRSAYGIANINGVAVAVGNSAIKKASLLITKKTGKAGNTIHMFLLAL